MTKERAQKKSFQQSLEDIKEKMKEKRNKRLESASAPNRGRLIQINTNSVVQSASTLLLGVQQNNKMLAVALQAEKEKLGHANVMILQLKRERQALFLHLILLKRKLKEQEAAALETSTVAEPKYHVDLPGRKRSSQNLEKPSVFKASPICTDPQPSERNAQSERQITLPSTVVVRRGHADRERRRRSERVQQNLSHIAGLDTLIASPIRSDVENTNQPQREPEPDLADPVDTVEFQHSTPEPVPPKENNQQRRSSKRTQQTPSTKPVPAAQKPERGRKADRVPLKKPWDKPRTRSKSRDRSATRAKTGPLSQGNKLNTSLGFNNTFDFDCEEAVHVTPFKAKAEDNQPSTPVREETPQTEALPVVSKQDESSPSSSSSESEDSLYVPERTRWRQTSPDKSKKITTRTGRRASEVIRQKKSVPLQQEILVFRDEAAEPEMEEAPNSPDPAILRQVNNRDFSEPLPGVSEKDCLPSVSPLVKEEMKRINSVLSSFGDSSGEGAPLLPHKTLKTCKKRGLGVRTAERGLSLCDVTNMSPAAHRPFFMISEALCSTPVPARKRRYTSVVDYKEPTINAKLRRGDKFTDLQFLRSPIFKQKSRRTSVPKSRNSNNGQLRNAMCHLLN
ncbi:shugoshin 1 isoform X3 [Gymnodraco acuticeps]|nr:shugoshin 1 isoform X3 [Gymnodraco acuticeps]XP_034096940.1 shugoshin 1 isoform X3 [Gymnodraco acuticeps]XP_034096941.1 shugoshin 1 isoform X3 [Gymnodraco acuticeps]